MITILVVDDEPSIRKALAMGLICQDCEVDIAEDGKTGIDLGVGKTYDVLLVDLCLPDMDGLDVIKAIKETSPEIIPIMITGHGSLQSSIEAIRLDVSDYIEKPLNMKTIKDAITHALEKGSRNRLEMGEKMESDQDESRALQELSKSIHMLVHQINNPLTVIAGNASFAMNILDDEETARECLKDIIKGTENITRINKEISKLGTAKINEETIEELNLKDQLQDCLMLFNRVLNMYEISVESTFADHDLLVYGNRFSLEQIFNNLILNAIHAMRSTPQKQLRVFGYRDKAEDLVSIQIQDSGCGIPPESLDSIFVPYYTTKKHGTGLGISVVKSVVKKHKGKVSVESRIGTGTTFTVSFPAMNQ